MHEKAASCTSVPWRVMRNPWSFILYGRGSINVSRAQEIRNELDKKLHITFIEIITSFFESNKHANISKLRKEVSVNNDNINKVDVDDDIEN